MARKTIGYVHLIWFCPSCGVKNTGVQRICQGCGLPQPDNVKFVKPEQDQIIKDEALISQAKKGADIHCAYCNARNPADAKICVQCGADLITGKKRQAGAVLGALQIQAVPEKPCPSCKTPNPITNQTCMKCGSPLVKPQTEIPQTLKKKVNPLWIILGAILGIGVCILLAFLIFPSSGTETVNGIVDSVYWERSITIQSLVQMEKENWLESIPSDAEIISCSMKYHHTQDEPAENSEEICGTPYIVDTGNGVGEQVVDCVYRVYQDYCTYTEMDWSNIDIVTQTGYDMNPVWPEPALTSQQQFGEISESYLCVFKTDNGNVEYQTSSLQNFLQCDVGSAYSLEVTDSGKVISFNR